MPVKITDLDSTSYVQEDLPCISPLSRELTGAAGILIGCVQIILGDDRRKRGWRPWFTWANNPPDPMWGGRYTVGGSSLVQVRSWLMGGPTFHDNSDVLIGKVCSDTKSKTERPAFHLARRGENLWCPVERRKGVGTYHRWSGSDVTWPSVMILREISGGCLAASLSDHRSSPWPPKAGRKSFAQARCDQLHAEFD